jgi:O-antigen chain-terminating methyltransferase
MQNNDTKLAELTALINGIRDNIRQRHPNEAIAAGVAVDLPDLLPILHARDAAFAKSAAIGRVNPRRGGPVNSVIQSIKRLVSRSLGWFVRDQVEFNRATVAATEAILAALQENNRALRDLAERIPDVPSFVEPRLAPIERDTADLLAHWSAWRGEWERKLSTTEVQFLRGLADLQGAYHHRATLMEAHYREMAAGQHRDFEGALERANLGLQQRFWADLERIRLDYEAIIHNELRVVRQRAGLLAPQPTDVASAASPASYTEQFDTWKFAEKFRGPEEYVRKNHEFYLPYFKGRKNIVDLGCGRGEFLALLAEHGIAAKGIEYSEELTAYCRRHNFDVAQADLFEFLGGAPELSLDGIFCAQVVEHLEPARVPELIRLAQSRLKPQGVLIIETPNPECLAIFATHFYLDPTHTRPIPPALLAFYYEEFGFGQLETRRFAPATEATPALSSLPEDLRKALFGAQDYAVIGKRL